MEDTSYPQIIDKNDTSYIDPWANKLPEFVPNRNNRRNKKNIIVKETKSNKNKKEFNNLLKRVTK